MLLTDMKRLCLIEHSSGELTKIRVNLNRLTYLKSLISGIPLDSSWNMMLELNNRKIKH
uniref:Uncharacterized protein n=1 Tax=virus sp. ctML55 TaxID=2827627 RepID=A0A8S5RIC1_9VIRU|nr:MAG TPA: hypothetical protein [virus sp. ctML55]